MAEQAHSRKLRYLPGLLSAALAASVLFGTVRWIGTPSRSAFGEDAGERLQTYLAASLRDAMQGVLSQERVYWIDRHALSAPAPNPACFGQVDDPRLLDVSGSEKLLEGQKLYFSPAITLAPGTPVRYYQDETILAITWKQVLDGGVYTFSEVKIAHPSQFRRFLAGGEFGSDKLYVTT